MSGPAGEDAPLLPRVERWCLCAHWGGSVCWLKRRVDGYYVEERAKGTRRIFSAAAARVLFEVLRDEAGAVMWADPETAWELDHASYRSAAT